MSTPGRDRWCHHIEPASAVIECEGEQHRITWRRGKLVLEDHDLAAEAAMMAFGGDMPACLKTLRLWRNLHSWAMATELFKQMQAHLGQDALLGPGGLGEVHQLGLLLTWERGWRKLNFYTEHGRLLHEQLRKRAVGPLREHLRFWMRERGCRRLSLAEVEVAKREAAAMTGEMDSVGVRATAVLGARWMVEVWGRGLAVVDGGFVLEVEQEGPEGLEVRAVRWDEDPARPGHFRPVAAPAIVTRTGNGTGAPWALAWSP